MTVHTCRTTQWNTHMQDDTMESWFACAQYAHGSSVLKCSLEAFELQGAS